LAELCPKGIDVYFDNVGGTTLDAVLACMADHGRIALCGATSLYAGGSASLQNGLMMLARRLSVRGFVVMDHRERFAEISEELTQAARRGELTTREDIVHGLEAAPAALLRLLEGKNVGKQLVQLEGAAEEPLLCAASLR
jgi:NADPH-dependent curcumin reductase CurA